MVDMPLETKEEGKKDVEPGENVILPTSRSFDVAITGKKLRKNGEEQEKQLGCMVSR